ncbi:predicted protein [Histoplasma mississippiense (nom. inval.)]|uniref:predicted protein n=1 Tax=Ajellomyces capsulatus (strain NAm1 / WU24) TaxID=2059318 RepID=UPI000157B4DF|nr:predicted protein [Histoplasma mississippiense (nom. inval.)]EDN02367.1 predicted protein [Histoplasma mississippiense (nom. inval.)]
MFDFLITLFFSFLFLMLCNLSICISHNEYTFYLNLLMCIFDATVFDCKVVTLNFTLFYSIEFHLSSIIFGENNYEEAIIEQLD